jgi:hypothetical protein
MAPALKIVLTLYQILEEFNLIAMAWVFEIQGKMMANDLKTVVEVQSVCVVALRAAIQMDLITLCLFPLLDDPL